MESTVVVVTVIGTMRMKLARKPLTIKVKLCDQSMDGTLSRALPTDEVMAKYSSGLLRKAEDGRQLVMMAGPWLTELMAIDNRFCEVNVQYGDLDATARLKTIVITKEQVDEATNGAHDKGMRKIITQSGWGAWGKVEPKDDEMGWMGWILKSVPEKNEPLWKRILRGFRLRRSVDDRIMGWMGWGLV